MNLYTCVREYRIDKYDIQGNKTVILVKAGDVLNEDNIYLNKRYCMKIN